MLWVDGVPAETKARLQQSAADRFGQPNASHLVRVLIAEHLSKQRPVANRRSIELTGGTVRVELRLPRAAVEALDHLAEESFSTRNYYINELIFSHLGQPQFHGNEIEVLRRSNYELAKVGTNLNQIAKAFNLLVKLQAGTKPPEIGKKLASLKKEISAHTAKVLRVLNARTVVWDAKGHVKTRKVPAGKAEK